MNSLKNKVAVVTGGNSGIGFASARLLKENGANVIITGRSAERVKAAAAELGVTGFVADTSDLKQIENLAAKVKEQFGKVDVLFINAGVLAPQPVGGVTEEVFDYQMDINFKGSVFTLENFIPILNSGASVITLSSVAAYTGTPGLAIYGASKAALNSYTRTAAIDLAQKNSRINVINPGPTDTAIFSKLGIPEEHTTAMKENTRKEIPLKRLGKPEEVAQLVLFLASDSSSFITGSEINIDGGMLIKL